MHKYNTLAHCSYPDIFSFRKTSIQQLHFLVCTRKAFSGQWLPPAATRSAGLQVTNYLGASYQPLPSFQGLTGRVWIGYWTNISGQIANGLVLGIGIIYFNQSDIIGYYPPLMLSTAVTAVTMTEVSI